jgi:hypothetical protein
VRGGPLGWKDGGRRGELIGVAQDSGERLPARAAKTRAPCPWRLEVGQTGLNQLSRNSMLSGWSRRPGACLFLAFVFVLVALLALVVFPGRDIFDWVAPGDRGDKWQDCPYRVGGGR